VFGDVRVVVHCITVRKGEKGMGEWVVRVVGAVGVMPEQTGVKGEDIRQV